MIAKDSGPVFWSKAEAPGSGTLQSGHEPGLQVQQQQLFHKTEPGLYPETEPAFTAERQQLD